MGKTDLDLSRDLFKKQMRQAKRLWTADWAESSVRHGESCMQSAQQHAEAQALSMAAYYQAERLASQDMKLARDQDSRAYEMAWRAEVRESLRDELANQYNRFNIVMLCDTVCLSCVFSLVSDGNLPSTTSTLMLTFYVSAMGLSITLFSISLWYAVIVVRRLQEHTAATLERKLFAQSEDLKKAWQYQIESNLPTGPNEIYLVNQAYEKWVQKYLDPMGEKSIHMMSIGVVTMFITAGLRIHNFYLIEYENAIVAVSIFWFMVFITSTMVLYMKFTEDHEEKTKQGVYDNSWQDRNSITDKGSESDMIMVGGPFAKISRVSDELFSNSAVELVSTKRQETLNRHECRERDFCTKTKSLHYRVESLRKDAESRAKTRKDVLQLLTTAAEELDALPEELTSRLNKLLHDIDEADSRTASFVTIQADGGDDPLDIQGSSKADWGRFPRNSPTRQRPPMAPYPIDAQRIPVSLGALRKKLGEATLSTLLRIKNLSEEPLRLKSGVQLKEGKYAQHLNATDPHNASVCYHLYPGTEIPPRSEVVVAARNSGGFLPSMTSGIEGEIVYTNRDETWFLTIKFSNQLVRKIRKVQVAASHVGETTKDNAKDDDGDGILKDEQFWIITKRELDIKANSEVVIAMDMLRGEQGKKAKIRKQQSLLTLKSGFLSKNRPYGLGMHWQKRWVVLTPKEIVYSENAEDSSQRSTLALKDIVSVQQGSDIVKHNVFEIHTRIKGSSVYRFSAASEADRDDWIQKIVNAAGIFGAANNTDLDCLSITSRNTTQSTMEGGFECVESEDGGTSVWPSMSSSKRKTTFH